MEAYTLEQRLEQDPKFAEKLIAEVNDQLLDSMNRKIGFERQWSVNIAFYYGHQYLSWIDNQYLLNEMELSDGRVRLVVNMLQIFVQRQIARIMKGRPRLMVEPANNTLEAMLASDSDEKTLNYIWKKIGVDQKLRLSMFSMELTGSVFLMPFWDPQAGNKVRYPLTDTVMTPVTTTNMMTGESVPVMDMNGQPLMQETTELRRDEQGNVLFEEIPIGEIDIDVCSPFDIHPNKEATCIDDSTRIIVNRYKDIKYVEDKYGLKKVQPETYFQSYSTYQERLRSLFQTNLYGYESKKDSGVFIKEVFEKQCNKYPQGRHYIIVNDKIVHYQEYLRYGKIPIVGMYAIKHPEKFFGDCPMTQAIPLQKTYNGMLSLAFNNMKFSGNPKIITYKNNGLQRSNFVADAGEILEVNVGGQAPYMLQGAQMPPQIQYLLDLLERQMSNIFSQHDITQGQLPYRIESAPAIQELTENDAAPISLTVMDFEDQLEKLGEILLIIAHKNYDDRDERIIKVLGENNAFDGAFIFKTHNVIDGFTVRVKASPGLPTTQAGKRDLLISLFRERILDIQNPNHVRGASSIMDMGWITDETNKDQKAAKTKIMLFKRGMGQAVTIGNYEDLNVQIAEFADYMKGQEYMLLKLQQPEIGQQIQSYYDAMNKQVQQGMQQQQQQQMQQQLEMMQAQAQIESQAKMAEQDQKIQGKLMEHQQKTQGNVEETVVSHSLKGGEVNGSRG